LSVSHLSVNPRLWYTSGGYCGKCQRRVKNERAVVFGDGRLRCPRCRQVLRVRPRHGDMKEKYVREMKRRD